MGSINHKTRPIQVWADVDEGIADEVEYLNTIPGVRTFTSCQGTIGECGPEPHGPYIQATWPDGNTLNRLKEEYNVEPLGIAHGYLTRKRARREGLMSEWIVESQFVLDPSQSWRSYHGMNRSWSKERAEASCARLQKAYPKKRRFRVKEKYGPVETGLDSNG